MMQVMRWQLGGIVCALAASGVVAHAQPAPAPTPPSPPGPQQPAPQAPVPSPVPPETGSGAAPDAAIAPALPSDAELVRVLGTIFSRWSLPATRIAAAGDPVLLDPRTVAPLVYLLRDPEPAMRVTAARMLGRMPTSPPLDSRVESALIYQSQSTTETVEVRVASIEALRAIGGEHTGQALREIYISGTEPQAVRTAARAALEARWPDQLAALPPAALDRSGRQGLIGGAALLGSYTLGAVGALGKNEAGTVIGVLGGAVTGGVTAAYLTRSGEITQAQAGWMVSAGTWGAALGMTTAAAIQREPDHRFVLSLGLIGEGAAFATAFATRKNLRYSASDVAEINAAGLLAVDLAIGGLMLAPRQDDDRVTLGVLTGAAVAGLSAGLGLARELHFSEKDGVMIALAAYEGTFLGALAPSAWFSPVSDDRYHAAGVILGGGLAVGGAAVAAQFLEVPQRHIGMMWLFGSYGKLLGYSVPLLTKAEGTPHDQRGVFLGSIGGLATGAVVASALDDMEAGDAGLVALGTGLGAWHGLGLAIASDESDRRLGGWFTLGTSVGGLGAIGLSRAVKLDTKDVQALAGGFFWGTWFSAWTAALRDVDEAPALRLTVAAGDAGLAIGGLLVSPVLDIDPRKVGLAYLGGLSGSALASLAVALATRDNDKLIGANLIGSAGGLALGAVIASKWKFSPRTPRRSSAPASASGLALSAPLFSPIVMAAPSGSGAMPGFGIAATFVETR